MIVAVDSSVIFSILKGEKGSEEWVGLLIRYAATGGLRVCDIVAAEVGAYFDSKREFTSALGKLNLEFDPVNIDSCVHAGEIYRQYRKEGGKREFLIPDFLIGAHAAKQADALAANDRGYFRRYFSKLKIVTP